MDISALPNDVEEMLASLRPWVECESPTWDAAAVNRMMNLDSYDLDAMGTRAEHIPGRMSLGNSVRTRFPQQRKEEPSILIHGHFDTIKPHGRNNNGRCNH